MNTHRSIRALSILLSIIGDTYVYDTKEIAWILYSILGIIFFVIVCQSKLEDVPPI